MSKDRPDSKSTRMYRALIKLCPEEFRREYGTHMEQTFEEMIGEERHAGKVGIVRLWLRMLPDLATTAIAERSKVMGRTIFGAGELVSLRNLMILHGIVILAAGIAFSTAPEILELYGVRLDIPTGDLGGDWEVFGFSRMFGVVCVCLGLLLLSVNRIVHTGSGKTVAGALAAANSFGAFWSLGAQLAMWETPFGWITVAFFTVLAMSYGFFWTTGFRASEASLTERRTGRPDFSTERG